MKNCPVLHARFQSHPFLRTAALAIFSLTLAAFPAHALTRTWDGGGGADVKWTTAANWDADTLPAANNDVVIDTAVTVDMNGLPSGFLPSGVKATLTNGSTLTNSTGACRMGNAASVSVGSGCTLNKYWAMGNGSMSFQNGAIWNAGDVELNGPNTFSFKLGPAGFTKLTPGILRWDATKKFSQQTWNVDMTDYTGPSPASIILMDCSSASDANMTAPLWLAQATRNVTNAGANVGSTIVYDPLQAAFVLKVQVAPYVPPIADSVWDNGAGTTAWTTATNWDPDSVPSVNSTVAIDGDFTVDMVGLGSGFLPSGVKVALTNGSTLTISSGVCRMGNAASVSVGSGCTLNKYWAMGNGSMSFQNGAIWNAGDVELSGPNSFSFKLGPAGFTKLTPGTLRWNGTTKFSQQTWNVDMADYTGPSPASIILMDCSSAADAAMTSALWLAQATRNVTNAGANAGSTIVYDPVQAAFVLKVQVDPYVPPVADLVWDGGGGSTLWTTATNWDPDFLPVAGNTVAIASPVTVTTNTNLAAFTVSLTNGGAMTVTSGAARLQGATINVASGSALTGGFWDLNGGTLNFQNGAVATMSDWELKGTTRFTFKLGAAGFSKLTPGTLRGTAATVAASTWVADMADYTGGPGIITLVDYATDGLGMGPLFSTSTLSVTNLGVGYTANLQWNNTAKSIELNVTGGGNPFTAWAMGTNFTDDANGDGMSNGLAWILGAADPLANASPLLPMPSLSGGNLIMTFKQVAPIAPAKLFVEYSNDLGLADPWHGVPVPSAPGTTTISDVTFTVSGSTYQDVSLSIPATKAAGGRLFGRLRSEEN